RAYDIETDLPPEKLTAGILTDSKGDYLSRHISNRVENNIVWWTKKGRTSSEGLNWLVQNFDRIQRRHKHLCIYIWLGTCDLTVKSGKYVSLQENADESYRKLIGNLKSLSRFAEDKHFKIVFLEVPFISLEKYNGFYGHKTPEIFHNDDLRLQELFNCTNEEIVKLNKRNSTHSPRFNCDLEKNRKNKKGQTKKRYNLNLYRDGIHPDIKLARHWLRRISERVRNDCYYN
ncbi:MAG: hypothetical protein AB2693_12640, partial [Candidatus Thiodiazotropha sp.]